MKTFVLSLPLLVLSRFFVVTDLHYDIAYQSNYNSTYLCHSQGIVKYPETPVPTTDIQEVARPFCDSSLLLIEKALTAMQSVDLTPDFILITGDTIGHFTSSLLQANGDYNPDLNIKLILQSFNEVTSLLTKHFPNTQIIPMIGNNDAYADYVMPKGWSKIEYLDFLYTLWKPLAKTISSSFLQNGYYITETASGYTVIVLNTMFFNYDNPSQELGNIEMLWLQDKLQTHSNILIVMHIPPGPSLYSGGDPSWAPNFIQIFVDLVNLYKQSITGIFSGHFHSGFFQFIGEIPLIVNPSISPLFGNNPGFRYYDGDEMNYTEYTFNAFNVSNEWYAASFESAYGYPTNFTRLYKDLQSGAVPMEYFFERMTGWWIFDDYDPNSLCELIFGNICSQSQEYLKKVTLCAMDFLIFAQFQECVNH